MLKLELSYIGMDNETEGIWENDFFFVHMTDPQLGLQGENQFWDEEAQRLEQAIQKINMMDPMPRAVFITGDLVNADPNHCQYDVSFFFFFLSFFFLLLPFFFPSSSSTSLLPSSSSSSTKVTIIPPFFINHPPLIL